MNESQFTSRLDKLHFGLFSGFLPRNKVKDPFILKKLSDYYFSKLLPDFFYHTPLNSNYYPTIIAARVTLSVSFLFFVSWVVYRRSLLESRDKVKKYHFNLFSTDYLALEKEMMKAEKTLGKKIILN